MDIAKWILLGAIIISTGLLITSYIKKFNLLKKICECLIIPLAGAIVSLFLTSYLPDSRHLLKVTIVALSFVTFSSIFLSFERFTALRILGRFFSIAGILVWASLYREVFFIYGVASWMLILAVCVYTAAIIAAAFLAGKQPVLFYGLFALCFAAAAYIHFCSLLFLCFEHSGSSIMLFSGTSLLTILVAFHFINHAKLNFKYAGIIRYFLMVAAHILIACSNILMIS